MRDNCEKCKDYLPDIQSQLYSQADYWGMESLTEKEQLFLEWENPKICPDCIQL